MNTNLKGMNGRETEAWALSQGLKPFQGRQIRHWLFKKLASSFEEMTNVSKSLRRHLEQTAEISHLELVETLVSEDGTQKMLFKLVDGYFIETVLIPETDHFTLCISSQAGCAMGCRFCATAKQGFKRNLNAAEIIDQVIQARRTLEAPETLTNIVFMGMGEPLANYEEVVKAAGNIINADGMNFSNRKVTLSTCGLVPKMDRLGKDITLNLAVSLNAADDETRSFLMPVNRTYPLKDLIAACRQFPLPNRRMITFEYILIKNVNDRPQDVKNIVKRLSGLRAKINLIALNPHHGSELSPPAMSDILAFQEMLVKHHLTVVLRKSKGSDIQAACGQLSGKYSSLTNGNLQ